MNGRHGSVLIVVTGLSALLATMALGFLLRMRSDAEEARLMTRELQARVMLAGALNYVQEGARLGWGGETFGWRDVRDGMPGPRGFLGDHAGTTLVGALDPITGFGPGGAGTGVYPAIRGRAARCPMQPMRRPPFAVLARLTPNPIPLSGPGDPNLAAPWSQLISYQVPDPSPAGATRAEFVAGDRAPLPVAVPAWFRCYRSDIATFVLTCGSGASQGFRSWSEAVAAGQGGIFGDEAAFAAVRADETVLWFEAQWSESVTGNTLFNVLYGCYHPRQFGNPNVYGEEQPNSRQQGGTFAYIQRLTGEPAQW